MAFFSPVAFSPEALRSSSTSDASGRFVPMSAPATRSLCDNDRATISH